MDLSQIVTIVLGLMLCFAGWWLFRISIVITGFILGSGIGYIITSLMLKSFPIHIQDSWTAWGTILLTIFFGLMGILLMKSFIKILLFLAGFLFGIALVAIYSSGHTGILQPNSIRWLIETFSIWSVVSGLLCGTLFILFERGFVIMYTCAVGAYLLTGLFECPSMVFYVLLLVGFIVQMWMSKGSVRTRTEAGKVEV